MSGSTGYVVSGFRVNRAGSLVRVPEISHDSQIRTPSGTPVGRSVWTPDGIHFRGQFWFPGPVDDFWRLIEDFDRYPQWWPWLQDFRTDTAGLVDGNVLRGTIVPPIPYRLRLEVRLHSCEPLVVTKATLGGDLGGHACLHFEPWRGGTRVHAEWTLRMAGAPMRLAARVARPLVLWGHDRVVAMAVDGMRARSQSATVVEADVRH